MSDDTGVIRNSYNIVSAVKSIPDERGETILFGKHPYSIVYTRSKEGVLRGIHFQTNPWCEKKVHFISGVFLDVMVDIRTGEWSSYYLVAPIDLFVPSGYAHGYLALSHVELMYEFIPYWDYPSTYTLAWDDPNLNIPWVDYYDLRSIIMSKKDRKGISLLEAQNLI